MRPLATLLALGVAMPVYADVGPTTYDGMTLAPIHNTEVEMRRERVRITCEEICEVHAQFFMHNATVKPVEVYIGFPLGDFMMESWEYNFQVEADNEKVTHFKKAKSEVNRYGHPMETEWFGWPHTFPPGDSTIAVRYRIKPSRSYYNAYSHNLFYILHSGSFWKGPIGKGVVEFEFPYDVDPRQISAKTTTAGYQVKGQSVFWTFENLEPEEKDNIHLELLPHSIFYRLEKLRRQIRAEPKNQVAKVELARHLFPLGYYKGVTFYVPLSMTPADYRATLALIKDPESRKLFESQFQLGKPCTWCDDLSPEKRAAEEAHLRTQYWQSEGINENYPAYKKLIAVLAAVDFMPPDRDSISQYVLRGQELLEQVLAEDPENAEAWFLYLSNYYRFKYSGYGPMYLAESPLQPRQIAVIERARQHCPKHPGIALWHALVQQHKKKSKAGWHKALEQLQTFNDEHGTYHAPWLPDSERRPTPRSLF